MIDKNRAARQPRSWAMSTNHKGPPLPCIMPETLKPAHEKWQALPHKQQGPALRGPLLKLRLRLG